TTQVQRCAVPSGMRILVGLDSAPGARTGANRATLSVLEKCVKGNRKRRRLRAFGRSVLPSPLGGEGPGVRGGSARGFSPSPPTPLPSGARGAGGRPGPGNILARAPHGTLS